MYRNEIYCNVNNVVKIFAPRGPPWGPPGYAKRFATVLFVAFLPPGSPGIPWDPRGPPGIPRGPSQLSQKFYKQMSPRKPPGFSISSISRSSYIVEDGMHLPAKPLKFQYYGSYFQVKWPSQMDRGAKTLKFGRAKRVLRLYIYFDL